MENDDSVAVSIEPHDMPSHRISVIMPVFNGVDFIVRSLPPLINMLRNKEIVEVIVVDDGSTDETASMAAEMGARVVASGGRLGPGGARNQASNIAKGDILWFVDADVVVHDDAARCMSRAFEEPQVVAVFGSYDDNPPAKNFFSQYKNLVHHYYHHKASEEAQTFWSGCGAVRSDAFAAVGGFDIERFKHPSIEDIELGHRLLKAGGKLLLRREILCTHLKVWRFFNLLHTEIFRRALPWSRLILNGGGIPNDLNVGMVEQVRAALAGVFWLAILVTLVGFTSPSLLLAVVAVILIANKEIALFFYRRHGLLFAAAALLFHQVYYFYSASAFAWAVLERGFSQLFSRRSAPSTETE